VRGKLGKAPEGGGDKTTLFGLFLFSVKTHKYTKTAAPWRGDPNNNNNSSNTNKNRQAQKRAREESVRG
jgi:hypothetical protein